MYIRVIDTLIHTQCMRVLDTLIDILLLVRVSMRVLVCCSALQCIVECCSLLKCVAACCSVLQY